MFNRHQAEITVMQFRGHSLPVHQSMSVPWEFFSSSHFISQFPPTWFSLITAIRMCHLLPVHHLGMSFLAGSKGQNTTQRDASRQRDMMMMMTTRFFTAALTDGLSKESERQQVSSSHKNFTQFSGRSQ